jgi:hypothetical protein
VEKSGRAVQYRTERENTQKLRFETGSFWDLRSWRVRARGVLVMAAKVTSALREQVAKWSGDVTKSGVVYAPGYQYHLAFIRHPSTGEITGVGMARTKGDALSLPVAALEAEWAAALGSNNHHVKETRNPAVGRGRASEIMSRFDGRDKERPTKGQRNDARRNT